MDGASGDDASSNRDANDDDSNGDASADDSRRATGLMSRQRTALMPQPKAIRVS